ncbi:hypothetical protein [Pseudomonas sp. p21]|uniref:hypothetical protein n=1 Tax=Pseudomonas sp. p21 TaxID=1825979 RepID=UPI00210E2721|nr:hypothetical protein [Pseudomonas sp. p21]
MAADPDQPNQMSDRQFHWLALATGPDGKSTALEGKTMNLNDRKQDDRIRSALRNADRRGQLQVVAAVTGIAGGVDKLREIMNSTDELHIMDRGMLALHLG